MTARATRWAVPAVFLLSLALRAICLAQARGTPLLDFFARDSQQYDEFAREILKGRLLFPDALFLNAVYPFFLALAYLVFGHAPLSALAVQVVLGAATTVLVFLLCRKVTGSAGVGLLAAFIHAGHDLSIFYGAILLDSTLSAFLLTGLLTAMAYAADGHRPGLWLLSGGVFGLSAVLRSNVLLFLPFLALWLLVQRAAPAGRRAGAFAAFCLGAVLVFTPFSLRRYLIDGGLSPFPASGGLNFYIGNNPQAMGGFMSLEHMSISLSPLEQLRQSVAVAERETGRKLSASEASRHWLERGLRFVAENPGSFVVLSLKKTLLLWNRNEGEPNINFTFSRGFLPLFRLPLLSFAVVGPLALTGMILASWRRAPGFPLLTAFVLCYMLSLSLLFVTSRYRLPCVPLLAVFAAYALAGFGSAVAARKTGEVAALAVLAAAFFLVAGLKLPGMIDNDNFSVSRFNLGNLHLEKGRLEEAAREYLQIPRGDPNYPRSRYNLGIVYERRGMVDEAMAEYRNVLEAQPDNAKAHNNLGLLLFRRGSRAEALAHYRAALAAAPDYDAAHFNLGWYYQQEGLIEEAYAEFRKALAANPENAAAHYHLALVCYARGDFPAASNHYREALRLGYVRNSAFESELEARRP